MQNVALFLFIAATIVAVFAFLSVAIWVEARANERKTRDRYALLRKISEQPAERAELVLALVREDDARGERAALRKAAQARRDGMQAGSILVAIGAGLSILLYTVAPSGRVWTAGLMLVFIGLVVFGFAFFTRPVAHAPGANGAQPQ
jgi:hypothetical protein